jgi:hypothetical protein
LSCLHADLTKGDEMEHIQQFVIVKKDKDHKSSLKFIGLISLIPILIFFSLIRVFPFDNVTIEEQNSLTAKHLSVHSNAQKNRKRVPLQPLEGLSAQEKYLLLYYAVFGKSVRESGNDGKRVK